MKYRQATVEVYQGNLKWQYFQFTNIRSHYFMLSWSHYQPPLTILGWAGPSHQPRTCLFTPPSSSRTGERIGKPKARKLVGQGKECSTGEGRRWGGEEIGLQKQSLTTFHGQTDAHPQAVTMLEGFCLLSPSTSVLLLFMVLYGTE